MLPSDVSGGWTHLASTDGRRMILPQKHAATLYENIPFL
jgi:hypothetical protein